ncbi:MAG: riboflavin synthase [Pirellulaceae bacterium]|nr:riboflavin synthase [Planctomycetales bacterium]
MFTGLVHGMGQVAQCIVQPPGMRLVIATSGDLTAIADQATIGQSIAINGCCLTVVEVAGQHLHFEAGAETLSRTNLGKLNPGARVNLETSLQVGQAVGGHFVTGHIDCVGQCAERRDEGEWSTLYFTVPSRWMRQMASKGSVAVDGVSLTLVDVQDDRFSVALIPHTLNITTLGSLQLGDEVNIETDVLAKYVERSLGLASDHAPPPTPWID